MTHGTKISSRSNRIYSKSIFSRLSKNRPRSTLLPGPWPSHYNPTKKEVSMATETTEYNIFVRTSDDVILDWDRTRIAEALIRETHLIAL